MSYSKVMPSIKPYPQEDLHHSLYQKNQQKHHYSVYRPAYHRIPSTPATHKEDWASTNNALSPIVVPSMIPSHYYHYPGYSNYHLDMHPIPIHHTLENATISYDTMEPDFQKELVKDVFFSPPMTTPVRELSPCSSSSSSTCEEPSELLYQDYRHDNIFDFGLDLATTTHTTSSYEEVKMASSFNNINKNTNKRRCSDSVLQERKKQRFNNFLTSPPESPYSKHEYSEDDNASGFESELEPLDHPIFWDDSEEEQQVKVIPKKVKKQRTKKEKKVVEEQDKMSVYDYVPQVAPRPTCYPTIYQKLTKANIDWCRYCGTTEGVNWRPGPWGKRTLCNKHGCDYKGYGFACKLPRLDLTGFVKETIDQRERPVLQLFCSGCQRKESWEGNVLVRCEGCPKAYHQKCCPEEISDERVASTDAWYCDASCCENSRRKRIVVELPRKRLPLMCAPKNMEGRLTS